VIEASTAGSQFVFGKLALPPGVEGSPGFILAFQALPTIIFFSALISMLYFFRIMPILIRGFASLFSRFLALSGAESLSASSNIFVGVESSFTIQPHLAKMTRSELCTVLTAGMATVASNVLALYVFTLREQFPAIAGHLISASILSAPAAIVTSKVLLPESSVPETFGEHVDIYYEKPSNLFEAIINGANSGVKVIVGVAALLIAVLGLIALVDIVLGALGGQINRIFSLNMTWSLKNILGMMFYLFTLLLGVPVEDATTVAKIIGERTIATEVAGYQSLAAAIAVKSIVHPRSIIITTYALCGFAHFASMAIFIGGIAALAPGQKKNLSTVGFRALCAATLACLMTACTAGIFAGDVSLLSGF
jgi:concentrative nucleoside transporter, CNT family